MLLSAVFQKSSTHLIIQTNTGPWEQGSSGATATGSPMCNPTPLIGWCVLQFKFMLLVCFKRVSPSAQ